jgi:predicted peptidase
LIISAPLLNKIPQIIHENLETLKDKPIFLMGSSFGGMMSVYHAINFPGTFTGYISNAGGLYGQQGYDQISFKDYLKVACIDDIKYIEDPVFIHHSLDDNRVNVKASLEFFRLAKLAKKEHLIKLFIDDHGSSVGDKEPGLHGHFFPERYYLQLFSEQLIDFINSNGKNIDPDLNDMAL